MLENVPFSAYTLCYGPLAITVIGFIIFAALTDINARRPYLRRLDMRPEDEREYTPPNIDRVIKAETPTGTKVELRPIESVEIQTNAE
jgi:hypothetical protein